METTTIAPNSPGVANDTQAVPSLDSIASKMTAMREQTERNLLRQQTEQTAAGADEQSSSPVATEEGAEVVETDDTEYGSANEDLEAQPEEAVSTNDSSAEELIDFIEFAETNPNAKFKFMRNGKEVVIDAKKAAAILGQGSAIHEEARQLKIEKAEFEEYAKEARVKQDGLTLALEMTVQPKLKKAYNEIIKTQGYQSTFQQQLRQTNDPAQIARIQASMAQNEQYIRQQQQYINKVMPAIETFKQVRAQQVNQALEVSRKNFQDKELRNEFVFNEVRDKLSKVWPSANAETLPGVRNLDLIASDEALLSLVRDGLRYRDKPGVKSAGSSMAALTSRKGTSTPKAGPDSNIEKLREQAKAGDKKAADNLLVQRLQSIRAGRGSR